MKTTLRAAAAAVLVGLAGAACTSARADTTVERPALEVPPPPPRVVAAVPARPPYQLEPVENILISPPTPPKPRRETPNQKIEPKPEEPKPLEPPPAAPPVQQPAAPQLRLPESSGSPQASQINEVIRNAREILTKVDYDRLPAAARKAYKESQIFATQAENELKTNNLAIAKEFADKAEGLAKALQGR